MSAGSGSRRRSTARLVTNVQTYRTVIDTAITPHRAAASGVATWKWLAVPAAAAPTITACSTTSATATTVPSRCAVRRKRGRCAMSHAQDTA
ncbi:hypothetical protein QFZ62_001130 [Clavibacter sp. B3I6]|nr:hypothetical protein [Clavibacter sp. B3I6]